MGCLCLPCQDLQECSHIARLLNLIYFLKYAYIHTYIHAFSFIMFFWKILPEIYFKSPALAPYQDYAIWIPHTGRLLPQACAYVLVCFYGQHIEESNVAEMLWWWLTQFKLVGKVTTGLSDFFTVPAKRIEGTTRADQQTYGEKRK